MKRYSGLIAIVAMVSMLVAGCSATHFVGEASQNAGVRVDSNVFGTSARFDSTGGAKVEKVVYNSKSHDLTVDKAEFNSNPEGVDQINVDKVKAVGEAQRVQVEYVQALGKATAEVAYAIAEIATAVEGGPVAASLGNAAKLVKATAELQAVMKLAPSELSPASQPAIDDTQPAVLVGD